jgi:hypothetical protein
MTNEQILDSYEDQRAISPADSKGAQDYCIDCRYYDEEFSTCTLHNDNMEKYDYCNEFKAD